MILELYSIKDEEMSFTPPVPLKNDAVARRWYAEYAYENLTMKLFPSNFSLYHIGQFNSDLGEIRSNENGPRKVDTNKDDRKEIQDELQKRI